MILEKNVSMIFPSLELGRKIASEDFRTQCQVLEGFATKQLLDCIGHSQPIISLVALLPTNTVIWFTRVYQEMLSQGKISKKLDIEVNEMATAD
ncbi:hypothetical protein KAX02_13870, partial [candidate division WOR-3 bacterium]|nr:hypothetical protein [candidate division WOR-3 bacterium]